MTRTVVATFEKKNLLHDDLNGAASFRRQCHWTSFGTVAPSGLYCFRLQLHPIRNTTGLVATVLEEVAFAADVPRKFDTRA